MAKKKVKPAPRRVSPLKPGLTGARNWATAQVRSASYSPRRMRRLVGTGLVLLLFVLWGALWLGGFIPALQASGARFTKHRLMSMGFVVKQVDVVGEGRIAEDQIRNLLGVQSGDYLFDMDIKRAQERVQSLSWVETAVVRRLWPSRIVVHVNERTPYALWQKNGIISIIDRTGVIITDAKVSEFSGLPFIVGVGAGQHASAFLDVLNAHEKLWHETEAAVYVSERRWDIILKGSGLRVLLPAQFAQEALARLEVYHQKHGILDLQLERIDMRIKGRLILRPYLEGGEQRA